MDYNNENINDFEPSNNTSNLDETMDFAPVDEESINEFFSSPVEEKKEEILDIKEIVDTKEEDNSKIIDINDLVMPVQNDKKEENETIQITSDIKPDSEPLKSDINNDVFSNEFNKLKEEKEILNMNSELLNSNEQRESGYVKYAALLPIFAFFFTTFLGLYLFTINTKAEGSNLIKIEENSKVGYIDEEGNQIVRSKYMSGTDYYKGFAIVKNQNNLSAVLDGKGNLVSSFGDYFYIERYGNRYITSKFTSEGLKLAILDSRLNELTRYKYDTITFVKDNVFLFTKDDTMGVLNEDGKEIYSYTVDEVDNKNISIEVSNVDTNKIKDKYAKLKINKSSTIISLDTGEEVYKYTLDDIEVYDNNIFYIKSKDEVSNMIIAIKNNEIAYETNTYKNIRIDDYDSDILIAITDNAKIDYIDLSSGKKINTNENIDYYYGDGLILTKTHDFSNDKDVYTIVSHSKKIGEFLDLKPSTGIFSNGLLKVYVEGEKVNFVNSKGKLINSEKYDSASEFNEYGYSIVSKNGRFGIVNSKGDEIIKLDYEKLEFLNKNLFKNLENKYKKNLFVYYKNGKCGIIDDKGNILVNSSYDSFKYITNQYPIIVGIDNNESSLINLLTGKELKITLSKSTVINENYIISDGNYYNYFGKLIYGSSKEGDYEE